MLTINNEATANDYTQALTLESRLPASIKEGGRLVYVVANASVVARFRPLLDASSGQAEYGPELLLTPQASFIDRISAAKFKSAVPGSPGRVVAQLTEPGDILPASGTPFTQVLSGSGAVVPDQMTTYTPTWSSAANPQPAIGNGVLVGKYLQIGALVFAQIFFKAGTTTTFGTGVWNFSLPIAPALFGTSIILGSGGMLWDISAGTIYSATWRSDGYPVQFIVAAANVVQNLISAAVPFAWAATDELQVNTLYGSA